MKISHLSVLSAIALAVCGTTYGQAAYLKINGTTLTIESGGTLFMRGDIENITTGGTIDNQGTIELNGNFDNSAAYTGTADTVRFSGAGHSDVTTGGAVLGVVEIDKDAGNNVNLLDTVRISNKLDFTSTNTKVVVGEGELIIQDGATVDNYDSDNYVITGGTGFMTIQSVDKGESKTFPIGASDTTYNPITVTGGTGQTVDDISVRSRENVLLDGFVGDTVDQSVVNASWEIVEGTDGDLDLDVVVQWDGSHEAMYFDRARCAVAFNDGSGWDISGPSDLGAAQGSDPYTRARTGISADGVLGVGSSSDNGTGLASQAVLNVTVLLQGPYSGGVMSDVLRDSNLIPDLEPYSTLSHNPYSFKGLQAPDQVTDLSVFDDIGDLNNIVDWVVVELRHQIQDTVIASRAALIQRDGDIVDIDGSSSLSIPGVPDGDYYVAVRHRNHLAVRSSATINIVNGVPVSYDFTGSLGAADSLNLGNPQMADLGGGNFGMWAGDTNNNNQINIIGSGSDRDPILTLLSTVLGAGSIGGVLEGYYQEDVDMNAKVNWIGSSSDRQAILNSLGPDKVGLVLQGHVGN